MHGCSNGKLRYLSDISQLIVSLLFFLLSATTATTVVLGHDRRTNAFNLLVLLLDFLSICLWVRVEPRLPVFQGVQNLLLLIRVHLLAQTFVLPRAFCRRAHGMNIAVHGVLCVNALLHFLVLVGELFRLLDHFLNLLFRKAALIVCDGDLLTLTSALVLGANIKNPVRIDFEGYFDLRLSTRCWWNSTELE